MKRKVKSFRHGQYIFNFLAWLKEKGYKGNQNVNMADPFYIDDKEWEKLEKEFILYLKRIDQV